MLKLWLRIGLWLVLGGGIILMWFVYKPEVLKPLIQAGVPVNFLSGLPILGDCIRVAVTPQITVQELKRLIDGKNNNFLVIDVRSPEE
ncbi:MAG: hypothetical protein QNJ47_27175 [Nostocaceae cyanobacterium]|nr:hypothetical protein [Nostocaceae cyanobacterium]